MAAVGRGCRVCRLAAGGIVREMHRPTAIENPLSTARFSQITNWEGAEAQAEISSDGRFVAFLADRAGQFDLWVSQVDTGTFITSRKTCRRSIRRARFSVHSASTVTALRSGSVPERPAAEPIVGRATNGSQDADAAARRQGPAVPRRDIRNSSMVSGRHAARVFHERQGRSVVRCGPHRSGRAADFSRSTGIAQPQSSVVTGSAMDLFAHGTDLNKMDIWRIQPSGETPERLTDQHAAVNFLRRWTRER